MKGMNCRKNHDGSTMIETLVGFLVVVLVIGMFTQVVTVSTKVLNSTRRVMKENQEFNAEYYKTENIEKRQEVASEIRLCVTDKDGNKTGDEVSLGTSTGLQVYTDGKRTMYSFKISK